MVTRRALGLALAGTLVVAGVVLWMLRPAGYGLAGLWLTPDQQGRWYVERQDYAGAAGHFRDPMWKGVACYRSGNVECAVQSFSQVDTADGNYNRGVAQAQSGDLAAALAAFERALKSRPDWREALENRDLVARLMAEPRKPDEETGAPSDEADEMKIDDEGKRGKRGAVEIEKLGPEGIDKLWLRNVRTDPAEYLRSRFAAESRVRANPAQVR